jgi:hypothetical protein
VLLTGFFKEQSAVSVVSYCSDILGYVRVVMGGFCKEQCVMSEVRYGSEIFGYVSVVMRFVNSLTPAQLLKTSRSEPFKLQNLEEFCSLLSDKRQWFVNLRGP